MCQSRRTLRFDVVVAAKSDCAIYSATTKLTIVNFPNLTAFIYRYIGNITDSVLTCADADVKLLLVEFAERFF